MSSIEFPIKYAHQFPELVKIAKGKMSFGRDYYVLDENLLLSTVTAEQLIAVKKAASKDINDKVPGSGRVYKNFKELERRLSSIQQIKDAKDGESFDPKTVSVHDLKSLSIVLKDTIIKTSKNRWIFLKIKGYLFTPVFVKSISYSPRTRHSSEHITMSLLAIIGKNTPRVCQDSIFIHENVFGKTTIELGDFDRDIEDDDEEEEQDNGAVKLSKKPVYKAKGISIDKVLERAGFYLSNSALMKEYENNFATYSRIAESKGEQHLPIDEVTEGISVVQYSTWRTKDSSVCLTVDGIRSKLITDDGDEEDYDSQFSSATGFKINDSEDIIDNEDVKKDWGTKDILIPTIPVVRMFDLQSNLHVFVAASSIEPYKYDTSIWEKLILPQNDMDFVQLLLSSTSINIHDIVQGKARGIIVVCSGGPGLGKTLTAEAASEAFQKPFYSVQCSQLGINPEELERNLLLMLSRASRWEAILLLDEADVYVRRRAIDIQQNAIVGVFLRVLEYYRGVMFMTTNLGDDIDDAILSRATAHLQYNLPTMEDLPRLWNVLAVQMKLDLNQKDIEQLIKKFGRIPGRSIRNLLKLAKYWIVAKKQKPTADCVIKVSQYLNVEHGVEKNLPPDHST